MPHFGSHVLSGEDATALSQRSEGGAMGHSESESGVNAVPESTGSNQSQGRCITSLEE